MQKSYLVPVALTVAISFLVVVVMFVATRRSDAKDHPPGPTLRRCSIPGYSFGGDVRISPDMKRENFGRTSIPSYAASPATCSRFCENNGFPAFEQVKSPDVCMCYSPRSFDEHQLLHPNRMGGRAVTVGWYQSSEYDCPTPLAGRRIPVSPKKMVLAV